MFIPNQISTSYGLRRADHSPRQTIPTDPVELLDFAERYDREAYAGFAAGQFDRADRLAHLAIELRARATGARV